MIPYGRQSLSEQDKNEVLRVLNSAFLTQGPKVPEFESEISNLCAVKHALAVNSATSALHIACLALGLKQCGRLWTTPNSFLASANCGLYCGATIDFVDIDPLTYNMSLEHLRSRLIQASKDGALPDILVVVHFAGQSCDMKAIDALRKEFGFKVIEDASHALGGSYQGELIGSCRYSDIGVFSFHPVKMITTGEGGVLVTNDDELAQKANLFRSHGMTRDAAFLTDTSNDGPWYYEQIDLGYNYRMTDIQAALGVSQLGRLDDFVERRRELVNRYNQLLAALPIYLPYVIPDSNPSWHLYVVRLPIDRFERKKIFLHMREKGIGVNVHYIPIHTQPYYQKLGFKWGDFPNSESYYEEALTLPLYFDMIEEEQDEVIVVLKEALEL